MAAYVVRNLLSHFNDKGCKSLCTHTHLGARVIALHTMQCNFWANMDLVTLKSCRCRPTLVSMDWRAGKGEACKEEMQLLLILARHTEIAGGEVASHATTLALLHCSLSPSPFTPPFPAPSFLSHSLQLFWNGWRADGVANPSSPLALLSCVKQSSRNEVALSHHIVTRVGRSSLV